MEKINIASGPLWVHDKASCKSEFCAIHKPSDHHMKDWPLNWRPDTRVMERICPHGIGHPDPDHLAFTKFHNGEAIAKSQSIHGCDGCCTPRNNLNDSNSP